MQTYVEIFANAAIPQKLIFVVLALATLAAVVATAAGLISRTRRPPAFIAELRLAGPLLGIAIAAMEGLHMMQTTARLAMDVTPRMLAPGLAEMTALVQAGALAGLVAVVATIALQLRSRAAPAGA